MNDIPFFSSDSFVENSPMPMLQNKKIGYTFEADF